MEEKKQEGVIPDKKTGIVRVVRAGKFSWQGFIHGLKDEDAFRQEFLLSLVLIPSAFFVPVDGTLRLLMIIAPLFVMIVELLNSAIEAVVDLASPGYHELAKQAKDMCSLAVLLAFVVLAGIWGYALYSAFVVTS